MKIAYKNHHVLEEIKCPLISVCGWEVMYKARRNWNWAGMQYVSLTTKTKTQTAKIINYPGISMICEDSLFTKSGADHEKAGKTYISKEHYWNKYALLKN